MNFYKNINDYINADIDDEDAVICLDDELRDLIDGIPDNPIFLMMLEDLNERLHAEMQREDATANQPGN